MVSMNASVRSPSAFHLLSVAVLVVVCATAANKVIKGTAAHDTMGGTHGSDIIDGGVGNDNIKSGDGNDVVIGGPGRDALDAGQGNDVYFFRKGDGQDQITGGDAAPGRNDVIRFDKSVRLEDVTLSRSVVYALNVSYGRGDKIVIPKHFQGDGYGPYRIDAIQFVAGKKSLSADQIRRAVLRTLPTAQYMVGYYTNDIIDGGGGNDAIYGGPGNDKLYGGDGNDRLFGDEGMDTLIGGPGNDVLRGELGSDTYIYAAGDGMDNIQNYSRTGDLDVIRFVNHTRQGVSIQVKGQDLLLMVGGTGKPAGIRIVKFTGSNTHPIARIEYREGPPTTLRELQALFPKVVAKAQRERQATNAARVKPRAVKPPPPPSARRFRTPLEQMIHDSARQSQMVPNTPTAKPAPVAPASLNPVEKMVRKSAMESHGYKLALPVPQPPPPPAKKDP